MQQDNSHKEVQGCLKQKRKLTIWNSREGLLKRATHAHLNPPNLIKAGLEGAMGSNPFKSVCGTHQQLQEMFKAMWLKDVKLGTESKMIINFRYFAQ